MSFEQKAIDYIDQAVGSVFDTLESARTSLDLHELHELGGRVYGKAWSSVGLAIDLLARAGLAAAAAMAFAGLLLAVMLVLRFALARGQSADVPSVMARHILVEDRDLAVELMKMLSQKTGDALLARFGDLARQYSLTCWSGSSGGALGTFGPGKMGAAFDAAAWSAPLMTVHGPVHTKKGYHLILVLQRSGTLPPAEQAKKDS